MIDGALAWVSWIAQWVGQFIPRWQVLDPTLGWAKYHRGHLTACGRAGMVFWWPVLTKVEVFSVVEQTIKLEPQSLTTKDGKDITVRGVIVYEYVDIEKMATTSVDPDDSVRDKALMVIADAVSQHTKDELLEAMREKGLDKLFKRQAQQFLGSYGVRVIRMGLVELAGARPYRIMQGGGTPDAGAPAFLFG